jgi:hypothetical protein
MKLKASLSIAAVLLHLSSAALPNVGVAHAASHKMRSAHFLTTTLEKKGFAVDGVHRKGQVYFVKVAQDGTTAILAIDGYSAEIIGLNVLILAPGVTAKAQGTGGNHFVDLTYEYGYIVEETVYEASYELTVEEISVTEEYTEVSYEESEEVTYEEVEETAEADLDDGTAEDAAGDAEADANDDADDGDADDADADADTDADDASDDASDDSSDDGADDGGAEDDGGDDSAE